MLSVDSRNTHFLNIKHLRLITLPSVSYVHIGHQALYLLLSTRKGKLVLSVVYIYAYICFLVSARWQRLQEWEWQGSIDRLSEK